MLHLCFVEKSDVPLFRHQHGNLFISLIAKQINGYCVFDK